MNQSKENGAKATGKEIESNFIVDGHIIFCLASAGT
jgi:hypothetical protein